MKKPSVRQIEAALDTLLWLHEESEADGKLRDEISRVRDALDTADGAGRRPAPLARTPTTAELRHWRAALGQEEGR